MIEYIHMGYESIYEKHLNIVILKGVVVLKREHDNRAKSLD